MAPKRLKRRVAFVLEGCQGFLTPEEQQLKAVMEVKVGVRLEGHGAFQHGMVPAGKKRQQLRLRLRKKAVFQIVQVLQKKEGALVEGGQGGDGFAAFPGNEPVTKLVIQMVYAQQKMQLSM